MSKEKLSMDKFNYLITNVKRDIKTIGFASFNARQDPLLEKTKRLMALVDVQTLASGIIYKYLNSDAAPFVQKYFNRPVLVDNDNVIFACFSSKSHEDKNNRKNVQPMALRISGHINGNFLFNPGLFIANPLLLAIFDTLVDPTFANITPVDNLVRTALTTISLTYNEEFTFGDNLIKKDLALSKIYQHYQALILAVIDALYQGNFQAKIIIQAAQEDLPAIIKCVLLLLPSKLAQMVSFVTNDNEKNLTKFALMSGVDEQVNFKNKDFIILNNHRNNSQLTSVYARYLLALEDPFAEDFLIDLLENKGGDEALFKLNYFHLYLDSFATSDSDVYDGKNFINIFNAPYFDVKAKAHHPFVASFLLQHFDPKKIISYQISVDQMFDSLKILNLHNHLVYLKFVNQLVALIPGLDDKFRSRYILDLVEKVLTDNPNAVQELTIKATLTADYFRQFEHYNHSTQVSPEDYLFLVVNGLIKDEVALRNEGISLTVSPIIDLALSSFGNKDHFDLIMKLLTNGSFGTKYTTIAHLLTHSEISFAENDFSDLGLIRNEIIKVFAANSLEYNLSFYIKLVESGVIESSIAFLEPYVFRELGDYQDLVRTNEKIMKSDDSLVKIRIVRRFTSAYLMRNPAVITLETVQFLEAVYGFYQSSGVTAVLPDETITQAIVDMAQQMDKMNKSIGLIMPGKKGDKDGIYYRNVVEFEEKIPKYSANKQLKLLYNSHGDGLLSSLFAFLLTVALLLPTFFFARDYLIYFTPFIAISALVSFACMIKFRSSSKRRLNSRILIANLLIVHVPLIIQVILLLIFYYV